MNKKSEEQKIKIAYAIRNFAFLYLLFILGCLIWKLFESHGVINNSVIFSFIALVCLSFPTFKFRKLLKNNNGDLSTLQALLSLSDFAIAICFTSLFGCLLERDFNNALLSVALFWFCYGTRKFFIYRFKN